MITKINNIKSIITWSNLDKSIIELKNHDILIKDGIITDISKNINYHNNIIDAQNNILTPGFIDSHFHLKNYGKRQDMINLKKRMIYLKDTKNGSARTVPLSEKAIHEIKSLPVSFNRKTFPISISSFRFYWKQAKNKANISDFRFHQLRHEAISRFFEKGLSIPEVALISGHRDVRMLFRYTHLKAEDIIKKL